MAKYKSLKPLLAAHRAGKFEGKGEFRIIVDNDCVHAQLHPGYDDDGEELGDPRELWSAGSPREVLHEAFKLLGLPSGNC